MRCVAALFCLLLAAPALAATSRGYATTTSGKVYWADDDSANVANITNFPFTIAAWHKETTDPGTADGHLLVGISPEDWNNSYMYVAATITGVGDRYAMVLEAIEESKSCNVFMDWSSDTLNDWIAYSVSMDSTDCYIRGRNNTDGETQSNSTAHTITDLTSVLHTGWCTERGAGHYGTGPNVAGLQTGVAWWDSEIDTRHVQDFQLGLPPMFIEPNYLTGAYMNWGETADTDTMIDQSGQGNDYDEQNTGAENVWWVDASDGPPYFWPMGGN